MAKRKGGGFTDGKSYDPDFLSPLDVKKMPKEPGPGTYNPSVLEPGDPLGYVPGGKGGKKIKGGK